MTGALDFRRRNVAVDSKPRADRHETALYNVVQCSTVVDIGAGLGKAVLAEFETTNGDRLEVMGYMALVRMARHLRPVRRRRELARAKVALFTLELYRVVFLKLGLYKNYLKPSIPQARLAKSTC